MPCSICARADAVQQIDDCLDSGQSLTAVAEQFGTSRFALARHLKHRKADAEPPISASQLEIMKWLDRADAEYQKAAADDDTKTAIAAIASGLRAVETQQKTLERETAAAPAAESGDGRFTLQEIDAYRDNFFASGVRESEWDFIQRLIAQFSSAVTYRANPKLFDLVQELLKLASPQAYAGIEAQWQIYRAFRLAEGDRIDLTRRGGDLGPFQSQTAN